MCVFSSHSFWTSSSLDVPAGVTQEEGHTAFLIHLLSAVRAIIFLARRIQPFLSLVNREVEFLCTNDFIVLHPLGIFCFCLFSFLVRKIPFAGIELKSQRVRGLRGTSELPGRPAHCVPRLWFWCPCMAINVSVTRYTVDPMRLNWGTLLIRSRGFVPVFVCVCVVIPFILDVRFVDVPAGVIQDFSTLLLRCLP